MMKRIGQVARELGVSATTLKNVERAAGFHPQRDRAGGRRYGLEDAERLRALLFPAPDAIATPTTGANRDDGEPPTGAPAAAAPPVAAGAEAAA